MHCDRTSTGCFTLRGKLIAKDMHCNNMGTLLFVKTKSKQEPVIDELPFVFDAKGMPRSTCTQRVNQALRGSFVFMLKSPITIRGTSCSGAKVWIKKSAIWLSTHTRRLPQFHRNFVLHRRQRTRCPVHREHTHFLARRWPHPMPGAYICLLM